MKRTKTNCKGSNKPCSCRKLRTVKTRMKSSTNRREILDGRDMVVVPVVMARADVPMNGSLIPAEQFHAQSWNGVPVTVGHPPSEDGSANNPESIEAHSVGRIFNATFDGTRLKAEAWVDVQKANTVRPDLISLLESGGPIDVSTGYFCDKQQKPGVLNGKEYEYLELNLKPDHLAILPDEVGACSWAEGCGVRSNQRSAIMTVKDALATIAKALKLNAQEPAKKPKAGKAKKNERGADDDRRQIVADLISNEDSPFVPDDEESLRMMSDDTLAAMRSQYLPSEEGTETAEDEETKAETAEDDETEAETAEDEETEAQEEVEEEKPATQKRSKTNMRVKSTKAQVLTNADREALSFARKAFSDHRAGLIERIVANSTIPKASVEKMDTATLETIANGIRPVEPNYSGRAMPVLNDATPDDVRSMANVGGVVSFIANAKKKDAA